MNNLFLPKEQKELEDCLSNDYTIFDNNHVIVYSNMNGLYVKEGISSKDMVWKIRPDLGLCFDPEEEVLYEASRDGKIYDAIDNSIILENGLLYCRLELHNGVLYGGNNDANIYDLSSGNCIYPANSSDEVKGLCSFGGKLYHAIGNQVHETISGDFVAKYDHSINDLFCNDGSIYALTFDGAYDMNFGNHHFLKGHNLYGAFVYGGNEYYVNSTGYILDSFGDTHGSFRPDEYSDCQIFDICVVPSRLVAKTFVGDLDG